MTFGTTGQYCKIAGKYHCFGNTHLRLTIATNEPFPPDDNGKKAIWILLCATDPITMKTDPLSMKTNAAL
jgi:hypothetical protein